MSAALRAYAEREAAAAASDVNAADGSSMLETQQAPLTGRKVVISGLLARPDLNGKVGDAISFDEAKGRYTVRIGDEHIALKPTNLAQQRDAARDKDMFAPETRVRLKDLSSKPELNECGGTVKGWDAEKERFVVEIDGSLKTMLLRASNLERDKRERWAPEMPSAANLAHIQAETERYIAEQAKNANPFAQMGITEEVMEQVNSRNREAREE